MAAEVQKFRDDLQDLETFLEVGPEEKLKATEHVLGSINRKLQQLEQDILEETLDCEGILKALKTAVRIDGLPYKLCLLLWNRLVKEDNGIERADIIEVFCQVFNDIEKFGVAQNTGFCNG
ncbi:hypothetical protein EDD18DRAFT_1348613 [Armillaria luteobubalina]|uniref:Uncharacterized protein n=1 Tax=Armillaria luteobubalina TaxID=153913 RepID=A0AA39QDX8_9AGAR|nr:hypothetical protein EDD18DRAFT_1348613 [Armillaria luteobubalina]